MKKVKVVRKVGLVMMKGKNSKKERKKKGRKQGVGADLLFLSLLVCFCGLGDI